MKLNREQLRAIRHGKGPLMIIAGAGTGKTTVITERIKHLIEKRGVRPSSILALTFTEKAASEMQERVDVALPYGYADMWISTFHSFCDRVLRNEALEIGLSPNYKILSQGGMVQLLSERIFDFDLEYYRPLARPTSFVSAMLKHFSRLQDEDISPTDYVKWAETQSASWRTKPKTEEKIELQKWLELAKAYETYDKLKTKEGYLDFGDLITKTLELFEKRPNVLLRYQEKFDYILIDEFQDTNYAQNLLAVRLAGKRANITVVGDDDQSIFRFRGAAVSNILEFKKRYKKARVVVLTKNYRSKSEILDASYRLILGNNPDRLEHIEGIEKKLSAARRGKGKVELVCAANGFEETDTVVKKILELTNAGYSYEDMAVLARTNSQAEEMSRAIISNGIPARFLGPASLFDRPEVAEIISFLKVLADPEDDLAMYRLLGMDAFGIPPKDIAILASRAKKENISIFEAAEGLEAARQVTGLVVDKLGKAKDNPVGKIIYEFLEETGTLLAISNPHDEEGLERAKNVASFFNKVRKFEEERGGALVSELLSWIETLSDLGRGPSAVEEDWREENSVKILTVHSAKGLEFPVVFMVSLAHDRFPARNRKDAIPIPDDLIRETLPRGDEHIQEERRLFYVGMTRARDVLVMSYASFYPENKLKKKPSPFIVEALGEGVIDSQHAAPVLRQGVRKETEPVAGARKQKESLRVDYLNYSMIDNFRICPLHYKLEYILKIPSPPAAALSLGVSVHGALRDFYTSVGAGRAVDQVFLMEALSRNWKKEGYHAKAHEKEAYEKAREMLAQFYATENVRPPLALEQGFNAFLASDGRPLRIAGRMDRIDDAGGGKIEIVDYKTGKPKGQKYVDSDEQLTFYALAASMIEEPPFGKKPEEITLTLHYLETGEKLTTRRSKEQLDDYREDLLRLRDEIEKSDFSCSGHFYCQQGCEYGMFCLAPKT